MNLVMIGSAIIDLDRVRAIIPIKAVPHGTHGYISIVWVDTDVELTVDCDTPTITLTEFYWNRNRKVSVETVKLNWWQRQVRNDKSN